jgi:hypothetical protein
VSAHTPGPWHVCDAGNAWSVGHTKKEEDHFVAHLLFQLPHCKPSLKEARANALLVAAAPDLLAALTRTAQWCHQGHGHFPAAQCGLCEPILAAIAKARGR